MESLWGLLLLLMIGLPMWRWIIWRKRLAVLRDSIGELNRSTVEVVKRLEVLEQRVDLVGPAKERAYAGVKPQAAAPAISETAQVRPEEAYPPAPPELVVAPLAPEPEEAPPQPEPVLESLPAPWSAPPQREEKRPEEHREFPAVAREPLPEAAAREAEQRQEPPAAKAKPSEWRYRFGALPIWKVPVFFRQRTGEAIDWEALIGGSWLNVIGIVVFVVGMVLLAQHSLRQFGPTGKIATGVATSVVLLACGIFLERMERYRLLAWTLVGGGWALLYFTAYAAHNIEASRIIADPATGLVFMAGIAAGILIHSLKYRSQLVTGLAYGLGFFAVAITPLNAYTLLASALLAVSQIAVLRFLPWHYLALIAVAGTYLNHARWLGETIGQRPEFWLSQGIIGFYWVLFVTLGLIRSPRSRQESLIHLTVNVANAVSMLGLSAWQIWVLHGDTLYYLTASAMLAYAGAAGIARLSNRADIFRFDTSVSVILFAVTLPLALRPLDISTNWLAIYWVLGGIAVVGSGYLLRELMLRVEGYALCGAALLAVFAFNLQSELSLADWRSTLWWVAPSVIAVFLGLSEWLRHVEGRRGVLPMASQFGQVYGYAATAILASFLWKVSDPYLVGLCWFAAGLMFFEAGTWRAQPLLRNQGYILFALSFAALLTINLFEVYPALLGASPLARWVIVGTSAAAYYYLFWRLHREGRFARTAIEPALADLFSITGTVLLTILAWKELDPAIVALSWIALGLLLFEVGAWRPLPVLRSEGYVLFALAFAALLAINLYEIYPASLDLPGASLLPRWANVGTSAAAYYYLFWRLHRQGRFAQTAIEPDLADLFSIAGTVLLTILAWKELDPAIVALSWIALGLLLFEVGAWRPLPVLRSEGYVLFGLAFAALLAINLYEIYPSSLDFPGASLLARWAIVGISATACYYLFWRLHREGRFARTAIEPALADLFSITGTVLLTILAWKELDPVTVAVAWAVLALALFEVGSATGLTQIMRHSHAIAILTFGRLFMANFVAVGEVMGISHRLLTVVPITALFYYFYTQTRGVRTYLPAGRHLQISRLYSWGGAIALLALSRFELSRAYAVLGMAPLFVTFLILGQYLRDLDFRFQSYVLAGLTFARCWATNAYLIGTVFGVPERIVTMLPAVAAFALASAVCMRKIQVEHRSASNLFLRGLRLIDAYPQRYFALLGATLMAILFYYELPIGWITIAFAIEGLILILTGIAAQERSFRIYGLVLLLVSLLKLVTIDVSGVEPIYRILSYIAVGLMLLTASLIYTRYRSVIEKYI
jgi:uncharacterized membrane protein